MGFNLIHAMQSIYPSVPEIVKPIFAINLKDKTIFTAVALFIYLICSQIPLYGVQRSYSPDPLYWTRVILASSRGTLMDLGIGPIISADWFLQFVQSLGLMKLYSKKDENNRIKIDKIFCLIFCFGEAAGQLWYGVYGPPSTLGYARMAIIIAQLMGAGIIVIMLDEMLKNGYGLGSGISLFIVVNTSEHIFWRLFSPVTFTSKYGIEFQGCFVCLVHFLFTKPNKWNALIIAFTRETQPNILSLCGTIVIFFIVIYLQGFQLKVSLIDQKHKGFRTEFPIKLFFTSTYSVILQSMFISHFYYFSSLLYDRFSKTILINLIGVWENGKVVGGFAWYISPPQNFAAFADYPLRGITYIIFMCLLCAGFSRFYIEVFRVTPKELAKKFRDQGLTLPNYRKQSVYSVLDKYLPTAAMLGGIIIGLLTILGDMMNIFGSSAGILLSVTTLYKYYQRLNGKKGRSC